MEGVVRTWGGMVRAQGTGAGWPQGAVWDREAEIRISTSIRVQGRDQQFGERRTGFWGGPIGLAVKVSTLTMSNSPSENVEEPPPVFPPAYMGPFCTGEANESKSDYWLGKKMTAPALAGSTHLKKCLLLAQSWDPSCLLHKLSLPHLSKRRDSWLVICSIYVLTCAQPFICISCIPAVPCSLCLANELIRSGH